MKIFRSSILFGLMLFWFLDASATTNTVNSTSTAKFPTNEKLDGQDTKDKSGKYNFTLFNFFNAQVKDKVDTVSVTKGMPQNTDPGMAR